ncbi:helix-turn-helix domain-containing protein [Marinobacterium sp. BA1]|uniref:helix-turn-helix domain-containing protein n=1 Tax=Marinobacterium sp. BA1 TaxID=3138931 RepID=UPI0032E6256B
MNNTTRWAPVSQQLVAMGERLNQLRILQGKTNEELELASGVGRATLSRLWAGKPVKSDTLLSVLAALHEWGVVDQLIAPVVKPAVPLEAEESDKPLSARQRVRKRKASKVSAAPLYRGRRNRN